MEAATIYNELIKAYNENNKAHLSYYAEQWFALDSNPFAEGTKEADLYYNGTMCYKRFKAQGISCRRARVEVVENAEAIAALNLPSPYAKEEHKEEPKEEPKHVLGVLPDDNADNKEIKEPEEKKHVFSKHKRK